MLTLSGESFARRQAQFVYRHAAWILAGLALLTFLAMPYARSLKLHANFMDLLPAQSASILDLKELNSHVGGSSYLIAVLESADQETARTAAEKLALEVSSFPDVGYVNNRTNVPEFESRKLLFLSLDGIQQLRQKIVDTLGYYRRKNSPFSLDLVKEEAPVLDFQSFEVEEKVSRIGGFTIKGAGTFMQVVLIKPQHPLSDFEKSEILFAQTRSAFSKIQKQMDGTQEVTLALTGPYKVRYDEYKTITGDLQRTGLFSAILIGLIMIAGFRSLRSIFYIYAPIVLVILLTCAFARIVIGYLNLISGFLFGILLGMGIDYAIHLRIALQYHFKASGSVKTAIEESYEEVGKPIFTSSLTTSAAFFCMAISPFEGFRHFGIISGAGVLLSFFVIFYGMPSLFTVCEKYFPEKRKAAAVPVTAKKFRPTMGWMALVLTAGFLFSVYSFTQIPKMKFDYNFANLQAKDEGIQLAMRVYKHFGVELTPAAFITPDRAHAVEWARRVNEYIKTHPETSLDFAASILSHVPRQQPEKIAELAEIDAFFEQHRAVLSKLDAKTRKQLLGLRAQLKPLPMKWQELPEGMKRQYEGDDGEVSVAFVFPKEGILDGQVAKKFVKELRALPKMDGVKLAGEPVVYADILALLERDTPRSLGLSFLVVILVLFFHFKKPAYVLWVLVPVVLAFLWIVGMAGAAGFKFNYLNVAILPSVLGAGIDNGIYIFNCYKEKGNQNFFDAIKNTGKGVILASFTAIAAFASLLGARHQGMASMGMLGLFGFSGIFLASVIVLPALIQFVESRPSRFFKPALWNRLTTLETSRKKQS